MGSASFVKPISGVYVFYNRKREVIYVGDSKNLERTFTEYVDNDFDGDECKQKTHFYQREFIENPKERRLQLIGEFKNQTGDMPVCNTEIQIETQ